MADDPLSTVGRLARLPPRGVEHLQRTPVNPRISQKGAAKSDALDATVREIIETWPQIPEAIRSAVLVMIRAARLR
jgi:hypothetical protein